MIQIQNIFLLAFTQIVIALCSAAVFSLTGDTADYVNSYCRIRDIIFINCPTFRERKRIFRIGIKYIIYMFRIFQNFFFPCFSRIIITFLIISNPIFTYDFCSRCFHPFVYGNVSAVIHIPGSNSTFDSLIRTASKYCY